MLSIAGEVYKASKLFC